MADIPVRVIIEAIDKASQKFEDVATSMGTMSKQANWGANALAALGVASVGVGIQVVKTAGEFEQQEKALSVMLGSAEKGAELFNKLKEEAKTTPFQLTDVVEATKQLMAMGSGVEEVIPQMRMLGDVSAGLGVPLERLIINFGQVQTQGKLTGRELRDFAIAGVPMFDELAKVMGVSKDAISDLVSEGKVGFAEVEQAFKNMTSEGGKFNNLMQAQSETTLGKFSNMKDAVSILSAEMGKALLPVVNETFDAIIPLITKFGEFAAANPKLVTSILGIGTALGGVGMGMKLLKPIMQGAVGIFTLLKGGVGIAVKAIGLLVGVLGGPLTIAIVAIVAIIGLLYLAWTKNWGGIQEKTKAAIESIKGFIENARMSIEGFVANVKDRFNLLKESVVNFFTSIPDAVTGFFQGLIDAASNKLTEFGNVVSQKFNDAVTAIGNFISAAPAAIAKFFLETVPYAIGFAVGRLEKFWTEDLPAFGVAVATFFTVTLPTALANFGVAIVTMLANAAISFWNWATVDVPAAISAFIAYLGVAIPELANNFVNWIIDMKNRAIAGIINMKDQAIANFIQMKNNAIQAAIDLKNNVVNWITQTIENIKTTIDKLPGMIQEAFNKAKENAINAAKSLYEGVLGWINKVKDLFQDIINKAGEAISRATEAFRIGREAGQRQFGGPVSASSPVLVGEKGPEMFVPSTAGRIIPNNQLRDTGGGGATIQFIINADLIINSPTERRNLAEALYRDLVTLARSQNTTVAKLFGEEM